MLVARAISGIISIFTISCMLIQSGGLPTVTITGPPDGSVSLTRTVEITGSASGSDSVWSQTTAADFNSGTRDNVVVDPAGSIILSPGIYDDFNDNSLDTARWTKRTEMYGVIATETGGQLRFSGTKTGGTYWWGRSELISTAYMSDNISADLASFSGGGSGYATAISMRQDDSNFVSLGLDYDPGYFGGNGVNIFLATMVAGFYQDQSLGIATGNSYNYRISHELGTVRCYQDNVLIASKAMSLSNSYVFLYSATRSNGDYVTAVWDNVKGALVTGGEYTSKAYDTLSTDPVLKRASWSADIPSGTGIGLFVRSSASASMASPTAWYQLGNGQTAGLPAVKRYLQYKVNLTSTGGTGTPVFNDISLTYSKPVKKVELSTDEQATWTVPNGTAKWRATLSLPEGSTRVWVRATDAAGDVALSSLTVKVDTLPPEGTIAIDKGAPCCGQTGVSITLNAADMFGVTSVILSEDPGFADAEWTSFRSPLAFELSPGDGEKTVYARFRDANGWESRVVLDKIVLDTLPPDGSVVIDGGAAYTRRAEVSLDLLATDLSGVREVMVSNSADFRAATWTPWKPKLNWTLEPGSGEHTVFVRFRDGVPHESATTSDSIILDTTPPLVSVTIDSGAAYTRFTNVSVRLDSSDDFKVESMLVSLAPDLSGASWQPFQGQMLFDLPAGDGLKTVYARVRDSAGNEGVTSAGSITLDRAAPTATLNYLPREVDDRNLPVGWSGADATSGVATYDLQYRDGTGQWTDWILGTGATNAAFQGQEGHNYSFRARARDRAGNEAGYPAAVDNSVYVWPKYRPEVTVASPLPMSTVKGKITISGTAHHPDPRRSVVRVMVSLDGGPWNSVNGTVNWMTRLDTTRLKDGPHTMKVQSYDGERYSNTTVLDFEVRNPVTEWTTVGSLLMPMLLVAVIAAVLASVLLLFRRRSEVRRGPPLPSALPPEAAAPPLLSAPTLPVAPQPPAAGPVPSPPAIPAPERMKVVGSVNVDDLEEPAGEPIPAPRPKTPDDRKADEMAARERTVLKALSSLPRGLASSLWGIDMDDLAARVVRAEREDSPDGDLLIKINNRWYFGDETSLGTFMQEYKKA